jgi:hypothetical protein
LMKEQFIKIFDNDFNLEDSFGFFNNFVGFKKEDFVDSLNLYSPAMKFENFFRFLKNFKKLKELEKLKKDSLLKEFSFINGTFFSNDFYNSDLIFSSFSKMSLNFMESLYDFKFQFLDFYAISENDIIFLKKEMNKLKEDFYKNFNNEIPYYKFIYFFDNLLLFKISPSIVLSFDANDMVLYKIFIEKFYEYIEFRQIDFKTFQLYFLILNLCFFIDFFQDLLSDISNLKNEKFFSKFIFKLFTEKINDSKFFENLGFFDKNFFLKQEKLYRSFYTNYKIFIDLIFFLFKPFYHKLYAHDSYLAFFKDDFENFKSLKRSLIDLMSKRVAHHRIHLLDKLSSVDYDFNVKLIKDDL